CITGFLELPGSRRVVIISKDQTASIVESETREVLKVLPLFEAIESAVLVRGNMITVGEEGTVKEWSVESARLLRSKKISGARLESVTYNAISDQLLITSAEENIFLVSLDKLSLNRQIVGFHDEIYSCSFVGKEDSHLAVASNTKEIRLYNTATWDCQLIEGHSESVLCVATAPFNRRILASCSKDNSIIIWKLFCELASQSVLNCLLKIMPPEELLELPNIRSTIESLIPYTRSRMADDLPMESIDDMPDLIDVDLPAQLPSLIEQNTIEPAKQADEFRI
ncbi:WD domain, G-beta repeat protein, partial [Teladorsagia circumcincta]